MVGMPRVGKMSRGICRSATSDPNARAVTMTSTVKGRRSAGWTRFMRKHALACNTYYNGVTLSTMSSRCSWLLLLYGLPTRRNTKRVNVWRKLKKFGAIQLKTSGYVLPDDPTQYERLQWLSKGIE